MESSKKRLNDIFNGEPSLKEMAAGRTYARKLNPHYPGTTFERPMGGSLRVYTPKMKAVIWGPAKKITASLLKTDVFDRRFKQHDPITVSEVMDGAYSEANKDFDDMPRIGVTRPKYGTLLKSGGRYDHQAWSESYPFPCQKPVGQLIIMAPDLEGADVPDGIFNMEDGSVRVQAAKGGASVDTEILMCMKRGLVAVKASYKGLTQPLRFRLYRHRDQGHRRYKDENGAYLPPEERKVIYKPVDPREPVKYYDYEADEAFNGMFEPPTSGADGRVFWVEQKFPAENTFPDGFKYRMAGMVSEPQAALTAEGPGKYLGTAQRMPRDAQGKLILPGRSVGHDDLFYMNDRAYSLVREAPGVAATAELPEAGEGEAVFYVSVATLNESPDYREMAEQQLREAEKLGYEALKQENKNWYDDYLDRRENGRIFVGGPDKEEAAERLFTDAYLGWSNYHAGFCTPDPSKNEGGASYAAFDTDTQAWHSSPCYNDISNNGQWTVRNRTEVLRLYSRLVWYWRDALREKARIIYGLPGWVIGHGYLPPAKPDGRYIENQTLDFAMEVSGQVMKTIWNLWDYEGDDDFLREQAYPLIRELAMFYEAFARRGWDGQYYHIEPTVETESYGISYQNEFAKDTTAAITMFRYILNKASETAEYLGLDADLVPGWREVAGKLPPYPTFEMGMGPVLGANTGIMSRWTAGDHEINTAIYPATFADEINLDSPKEMKELIIRTADATRTNANADAYVLAGAFAEYTTCAYSRAAQRIEDAPTLAQELIGVPERFLNSRSGRIHLFPVVPKDSVIAFRNCLARGGFEVSAAKDAGGVICAVIKARRGGECRLMNPWPGQRFALTDGGRDVKHALDAANGECIVFETKAGHEYELAKI